MEVRNKKWTDARFEGMRKEVLAQWPVGDVDLNEAVAHHKSMGPSKSAAMVLAQAKREGRILLQPRAGVAVLEENVALLRTLRDEGKADILPTSVDSYTRDCRFADATKALEASRKAGRSLLNGFPVVSYGVQGTRQLIDALDAPMQLRINAPDVRLAAEVSLAAGFSAFVSGPICATMHYSKNETLERGITLWQYVDRLIGRYAEMGVIIPKDHYGVFAYAGLPPSLSHAGAILEILLAAEQGVKCVVPNAYTGGNLPQDIAGIQTLGELTDEYLRRLGYTDVSSVVQVSHWPGAFPDNEAEALAVICLNTMAAVFGKATEIMVKSSQQGVALPSRESNVAGLRATRFLIGLLQNQAPPYVKEVDDEAHFIRLETRAILDRILELGDGDVAVGIVRGFEAGVIEAPFAANRHNANNVMAVRDAQGANRFFDCGNLPFSNEIKEFHRQKIAERERGENREVDYQMIIDSILSISHGALR